MTKKFDLRLYGATGFVGQQALPNSPSTPPAACAGQKMNTKRFDNIMLNTKTVGAKATPAGIEVTFASAVEGGTAPAPQTYDLVLQAVGRTPNGKKIAADKAGVAVTDRGFINVDIQMRTNVPHIFAIGDIVGHPC